MNIRVLRPYLFSLLKLPRVRMKECKEAAENGGEMKRGSVALPVGIEKNDDLAPGGARSSRFVNVKSRGDLAPLRRERT